MAEMGFDSMQFTASRGTGGHATPIIIKVGVEATEHNQTHNQYHEGEVLIWKAARRADECNQSMNMSRM